MSKDTALVIIDTQVAIIAETKRAPKVLANINLLLTQARENGTPVIYVQHHGYGDNHPLRMDTPGWAIHPEIAPHEGEPVVHKTSPDSFHDTTLQQELAQRNITHLVVVGGETEMCVDTTIRRATTSGYDVTVVSDAHFTYDEGRDLTSEQIINFYNNVWDGFWGGEHRIRVLPAAEVTL